MPSVSIPHNWNEALNDPRWKEEMVDEMKAVVGKKKEISKISMLLFRMKPAAYK